MTKLIGKFRQVNEDNGIQISLILQNFNNVINVISTDYDTNTGQIIVTLNVPVLNESIAPMYFLGNDVNLKLVTVAINQTQFVIKPTELDNSMVSNCEFSYFEIPVFL